MKKISKVANLNFEIAASVGVSIRQQKAHGNLAIRHGRTCPTVLMIVIFSMVRATLHLIFFVATDLQILYHEFL